MHARPTVKIPSVTALNSFIRGLIAMKNEPNFACSSSRCTPQARRSAATGSTAHVGRGPREGSSPCRASARTMAPSRSAQVCFFRRETVRDDCLAHGALPGRRVALSDWAAGPKITLFVLVFKSSSQREKNIENQNKSKGIVQSPLSFVGCSPSVYKYSCHISENTSKVENASKVQKTAVKFLKRWVKSEIKRRLELKKAMKNKLKL